MVKTVTSFAKSLCERTGRVLNHPLDVENVASVD